MLLVKFQDNRTSCSGEDFLKGFSIYRSGGHLGNENWTIYLNFLSPFPRRLHMKFGFDWLSSFREDELENGGHILVYSTRKRQTAPYG